MKFNTIIAIFLFLLSSCGKEEAVSGDQLFEEGKFEEAIESYSTYLETNPTNTKILYNRGRAYEELGILNKATADFEKIIKIDPKNVSAYLGLAKLSYNDKQFNKVLVYATEAIELNEHSPRAHFLSARGAHQLGYFTLALESYNNAITLNKDYGEAYLYRGALKIGMEKPRSACEDFKFAKLLNVEGADKAVKDYCK